VSTASAAPTAAPGFCAAVLRGVSWQAIVATQLVGALFALTPWLEQAGQAGRPNLILVLALEALVAVFLVLAALAGDELARRGWSGLPAFAIALLFLCGATAISQAAIDLLADSPHSGHMLGDSIVAFFSVGSTWALVLLVYLNRQSAARLLASVRSGELARAQSESRLIDSSLAVVEAQIDPTTVSRQLREVRDLYAADHPDAGARLEALIIGLREKVARCTRAQ
jgi:hypothetical protein